MRELEFILMTLFGTAGLALLFLCFLITLPILALLWALVKIGGMVRWLKTSLRSRSSTKL